MTIHTNLIEIIEICCIGGTLFIFSNLWFYFRVLKPVQRLAFQADLLSQGDLDSFEQECGGIGEIQHLHRAMAGMVGHVRRAQKQNRAYAEQLAAGQEAERKRIAQELHDDTIQSLVAITQGIDLARGWVQSDKQRASSMLQTTRANMVEIITRIRDLIGGLRPPALEELGLVPALKMEVANLPDSEVELQVMGDIRRLDEGRELILFRVAQEALRNISKHADAKHVNITLAYLRESINLAIGDNGCGFYPPANLGDLAFMNHYGLLGIQERVMSLNGQLEIESNVGQGTQIRISLPTDSEGQPDQFVRDPVCSALIEPHRAYSYITSNGVTYYFCCPVCQGAFQKQPNSYLTNESLYVQ